jgi:arylsulfatase A-like enzyme
MISRMDRDVGRLFDKLRKLGIDENTIVFFSSDNGPHKEGGAKPEFFDSNGVLRGIKRDLYEGGIRMPMIVCWPGTIEAGSVSDHISAFWDFLPTAAELGAIKPPDNIDGISMLPTLLGEPHRQKKHKFLYWEFHEQGKKQAVRMGDHKGVRLNVSRDPSGPIELYNVKTDIAEKRDVALKKPKIVVKMERYLITARTQSEDFPLPKSA